MHKSVTFEINMTQIRQATSININKMTRRNNYNSIVALSSNIMYKCNIKDLNIIFSECISAMK